MHITISHFFAVSVLLGCSCCSTVDETLENVARRLGSRMKKEKSHWAAGRVGDIDFLGPTKTRGKVRLDVITSKESVQFNRYTDASLSPLPSISL